MKAPETADLTLLHGLVLTLDAAGTRLEDGGIAVLDDRIVAVASSDEIQRRFDAAETIDASGQLIMPGLIDTYTHAGHGLVRGLFHPAHGWPAGRLYWRATSLDWWRAEARLAALERTRCGVTSAVVIVGSTPARVDEPDYALAVARAHADAGLRVTVGVGPPDPLFPHLDEPWEGTRWNGETPVSVPFDYEAALSTSIDVIRALRERPDALASACLAPPYLFGRHVAHKLLPRRFPTAADAVAIGREAERMRSLADDLGVLIHTHMFRGSVAYALEYLGADVTARVLGPDVTVAHANGMAEPEVEALGASGCAIAAVPTTHENLWYGFAPMVELQHAGAVVTVSSDGAAPYRSLDLWRDLGSATWNMWHLHRDQAVMAPESVLRMVTSDAARAIGAADQLGSLEVGKLADIVTIDLGAPHFTPLTSPEYQLVHFANGADVDTVIVAGRIVKRGAHLLRLDADEVRADARLEADRAFVRSGADGIDAYRWR